jgi:undecaprenyl-diphosphatase
MKINSSSSEAFSFYLATIINQNIRESAMNILEGIILGIIQGITEWLPISSKSHLIIVQRLFGLVQPPIFDLILHIGSLIVVTIVFWKEIKELVQGLMKKDKKSWQMAAFIIIATIPIAAAGFLLKKTVENSFNDLKVLGFGFLFTASIIYLSRYPQKKEKELNIWNTLTIGILQIASLFPGVSRSGTTLSTGMILGIKKEDVAKFSFLIFIPAILGATVLEFKGIGTITDIPALIIGTIVTIIVGYLSLKLLLTMIKKDQFKYFSIYCLLMGIAVLLFAYNIV